MVMMRRLKKGVQWYDGMLLRPEHFQQADRRQDQLAYYRLAQTDPYFYGVSHLVIDEELLPGGILRITELEGMIPDGTVAVSYGDDGDGLELDIKAAEKALGLITGPLLVYLGLPEYRADAAALGSENPRYASVESNFVVNENTGEETPRFAVLSPKLRLFLAQEAPKSFVSIPLMSIENVQGAYKLGSFLAPCMQVPITSVLGGRLLLLVRELRSKISFLAERTRSDASSFIAQEAVGYIRRMTAGLLGFEARLHSNKAHPYDLFVGLCEIAGHISGLRTSEVPPTFSAYDHKDLDRTFAQVINYVNQCLASLQEGYAILEFQKDDRVFKLSLSPAIATDKMILGIKGGSDLTQKDLVEWATSAVIATKGYVVSVRDKRILGAKRRVIEGNERMRLVPSSHTVLIEITRDHSCIDPQDELQVFNMGDIKERRPQEVVMYVEKSQVNQIEPIAPQHKPEQNNSPATST